MGLVGRWLEPRSAVQASLGGTASRSALPALQVVDSDKFIETNLPRTKVMLEGFLTNPATSKKTPLAILHEYASRMSLEVGVTVLHAPCKHASLSCILRSLSEARGPLVDCYSLGQWHVAARSWCGAVRCCRCLTCHFQ